MIAPRALALDPAALAERAGRRADRGVRQHPRRPAQPGGTRGGRWTGAARAAAAGLRRRRPAGGRLRRPHGDVRPPGCGC
ncbi:hypothetical protein ACFSTC_15375 [Nonomuraea ferruginea]